MKLLHTISRIAAACALLASVGVVQAQSVKPGLWEITTQMQGESAEMKEAMAEAQKAMENMPPEQRKMMQDMLARQGVQMGKGGPGSMSVKICLTKEMAERNEVDAHQDGCTHTRSQRSGNTMAFSFVCTQPPSSGEGQVTFHTAESYSMQMSSTSGPKGKGEKMSMQGKGRWLGADCGSVKPVGVGKK